MTDLLAGVDQRTKLVGHNRIELLLFRLKGKQRYGINVFKVQEVIQCPPLTHVPNTHPMISGVATIRGKTIPVIDLGKAIGGPEIEDLTDKFIVVSEFNHAVIGFIVWSVDRIINKPWEEILPPPPGAGKNSYVISVTQIDKELIEILDVEKVRAEIITTSTAPSDEILEQGRERERESDEADEIHVLVVDDSSVARNQVKRTLEQLGMNCTLAKNGREALEMLIDWHTNDPAMFKKVDLVLSDIEMPEMDGYTLTTKIREDERLANEYIILHSSLSGVFNKAMVEKVGADKFIAKYNPDELAKTVLDACEAIDLARREALV